MRLAYHIYIGIPFLSAILYAVAFGLLVLVRNTFFFLAYIVGKSLLNVVLELSDEAQLLNIDEHIANLIDASMRRKIAMRLQEAMADVSDNATPIERTIAQTADALLHIADNGRTNVVDMGELRRGLFDTINTNQSNHDERTIKTGFRCFDNYGGMHLSDLCIVAAESSQGKTALATTIAVNAAMLSGAKVCMFSMEMTPTQLAARMLAPMAKISSNRLLFGRLSGEELMRADKAIGDAARLDHLLFFDNRSINNIDSILNSIRTMYARKGVVLFVIDYIQIIELNTKGNNNEQAIADAARRLKNIAKELNVCIILLSQLNRDRGVNGNPEPTAARLRASGQINEAADLTLLVYRPCVYNRQYPSPYESIDTHNTAMLKVDKDRNGGYGGIGSHIVGFVPETTHFFDLEELPKLNIASNATTSNMPF